MSKRLETLEDLISQVRSQIDEENQDTVSDTSDILPSLNRAQDYAMNILARHYEEPLLVHTEYSLTARQAEYELHDDIFEDRLEKVEVSINGTQHEVKRASYRDLTDYETRSSSNIPYYYAVVGNKFRLVPAPTGTYPLRLWYLRSPEKLVEPQGRITKTNAASNYIVVDSIGEDITTVSDDLNSYVNVVDGRTGRVKASFQVKSVSGNRITFKTTPTSTTRLGRTISTDMTALEDPDADSTTIDKTVTIDQDDYLCNVRGSCVVTFARPVTNFYIQYAVAEMTRKLGGSADMEERVLKKFEDQVEHTWAGREQKTRVSKRSRHWGGTVSSYRRFFTNSD